MNQIINEPIYKEFLAKKGSNSAQTKAGYAQDLDLIRRTIKKEVYKATDADLEGFIYHCKDKKLSRATIKRYMAAMASFFKYEITHKNRKDDPSVLARDIELGYPNQNKDRGITTEQRQEVFDSLRWDGGLHEYQVSLGVLFGFKVGLRVHEIAKIENSHIDLKKKEIFVLGKGGKEAWVPLTPTILAKLNDYSMLVDKEKIDSRWLFFKLTDPSKHYTRENIAKWFKIIEKRTGIKMASHDGRRRFCSDLHDAGVPDFEGSQASRHGSIQQYKSYCKLPKAKVAQAVNKAIS